MIQLAETCSRIELVALQKERSDSIELGFAGICTELVQCLDHSAIETARLPILAFIAWKRFRRRFQKSGRPLSLGKALPNQQDSSSCRDR